MGEKVTQGGWAPSGVLVARCLTWLAVALHMLSVVVSNQVKGCAPSRNGLSEEPQGWERATLATAVRWSLEELSARAPGGSVEVRVPPFGVTQCVEGPRHTRGTPPNVVETDPEVWLRLVSGRASWDGELAAGRVRASGERAVLAGLLPLGDFASEGTVEP